MADSNRASWLALRDQDRDLAYCLFFVSMDDRAWLADVLTLGRELEAAIRIPSEPMLAAIRLQWWHDALEGGDSNTSPLVQRLQAHMAAKRLSLAMLHAVVGSWQDRLHHNPENAAGCWADLFALLVDQQSAKDLQPLARIIGAGFAKSAAGQMPSLTDLRRDVTPRTRWLFMAACLVQHHLSSIDGEDDPLLIWRMLGWRYGVRLPS